MRLRIITASVVQIAKSTQTQAFAKLPYAFVFHAIFLAYFPRGVPKVRTNQLPGAHSLSLRRGSDGEMNLAMSSSARSANGDDSFADGERPAVNLAMRQQSPPDVILSWFFASDYRSDCDASASHQRLRVFAPFSISIVESLNRTNIKGLPAIPSNHIFRHRH